MASRDTTICPMCGAAVQAGSKNCRSCGEVLRPIAREISDGSTGPRWVTNPSLRVKYIIGGGTIWLVAYYVLFLTAFGIAIVVQVRTGSKVTIGDDWLWIIGPKHIGSILIGFALLAYYVVFLFRSSRFTMRRRLLWLPLLLFLGTFSTLAFFFYHVWPIAADERRSMSESTGSARM